MLTPNFAAMSHWFSVLEVYLPAVVVTLASAVLVGCAVSGICSPCKEKDVIFRKRVL